ncbi:uncharacterized protein Dwil_GK27440 [Drosophila willistoni]|nr:uncharacterized protein Dwil_GK27440 [Drosophila willistoni]
MYIVLYLVFILIKSLETALVWNTEGEASIFVAIAVPIDLPRKEVFLSYNFMASYRLPKTWSKKTPIFHKKKHKRPHTTESSDMDDYKDFFEGFPVDGMGDSIPRHRAERSLLSRTKFYEILSHRFEQHDLGSGDSCLLRLICETNSYQLAEINGLLGHLMHIMFSPSSSHYEALPQRYYIAEMHGQRKGNCEAYHRQCPQSVLDLITQPVKQGKYSNN